MNEPRVYLSRYHNTLSRKHQIIRMLWTIAWGLFARPLPRSVGSRWKRFLLQLFGAKIDATAKVYSTAKVYYPANLTMEAYSCLASDVDCYNVAPITIGANATISQGTYLCTASHDISDPLNHLVTAPIIIKDQASEDIYAMAGLTQNDLMFDKSPYKVARTRLPWLVITFIGEMIAGIVVAFFQQKITVSGGLLILMKKL